MAVVLSLNVVCCSVTWYDSACSGKQAAGKAAEAIMRNQVDVLIGPPCSEGKYQYNHQNIPDLIDIMRP